jgi:hypothetical protein
MSRLKNQGIDLLQEIVEEIEDEITYNFIRRCLDIAPDYFWEVPSSISGKHHPEDEIREGGLVLHTWRAGKVALELIRALPYPHAKVYRDKILGAVILHDTLKHGFPEREARNENGRLVTDPLHPIYPRVWYAQLFQEEDINYPLDLFDEMWTMLESHMGRWSPKIVKTSWTLTEASRMVHLADYIASRSELFRIWLP